MASNMDTTAELLRRAISTTQYTASDLTVKATQVMDQIRQAFPGMVEGMLRMKISLGLAVLLGLSMVNDDD